MALTLRSIVLLFRCFSKERLIWAFLNHRWFFWIPFRLNCSLQKHNAFLFQCFSVVLSCTFKNIGDILKFAERFIMMTFFRPSFLFFPTCIILPVTTTWLILWHNKLDVGKKIFFEGDTRNTVLRQINQNMQNTRKTEQISKLCTT